MTYRYDKSIAPGSTAEPIAMVVTWSAPAACTGSQRATMASSIKTHHDVQHLDSEGPGLLCLT